MKCLSVCQPYANLIVSGKKTIELRNWNTNFRGEFLVHAPTTIKQTDCQRLKISKNLLQEQLLGKLKSIMLKNIIRNQKLKTITKNILHQKTFLI